MEEKLAEIVEEISLVEEKLRKIYLDLEYLNKDTTDSVNQEYSKE